MTAQFLIRLDDACATMDSKKWELIEAILDQFGIKPLVAVIPDNCDTELMVDTSDVNFWDKVRMWQAKGWTISMHGYKHLFHHVDRRRLVLPFYDRSEFAGLSLKEQSEKIRSSWRLFQAQDINPSVWIAPAHCFDLVTLDALRSETSIRVISDGIARNSFYEYGFFWLPQQIWSLEPRRSGLWTLCLHPNTMSFEDIGHLGTLLSSPYYRERIVAVENVKMTPRRRGVFDYIYAWAFWNRIRIVSGLVELRRAIHAKKIE